MLLKNAFTFAPIVAHIHSSFQSIIKIDASDYAIGAVHSQVQGNGRVHPCAFLWQKFSPAELNYDINDKAMLAIVLGLKNGNMCLSHASRR